jgi:tetratricopeptide (TPR) repeat protein
MISLLEEKDGQVSAQARRLQARDMFMHGEQEKGLENFRKIAENSKDFRDHLQLGQILGAFGQQARQAKNDKQSKEYFEDAEKSLRKAVELAPDETSVWLALVQFLSQSGKESEALKVIDDARKTVDKQRLPLALARCFQSLGRGPEAEQQYRTALANSDGKDSAARLFAAFYLQDKKNTEAENLLKKIIDGKQTASEDDVAWARRRMALLLYNEGDLAKRREAITLIDENLKKDPSSTDDIREKARFLAAFGSPKELQAASKLVETLLAQPNPNPDDRFLMAGIMLAEDDWSGVTRQMQQLLADKNAKPVWLRFYIDSLLKRNEIGSAEAYLKRLEQIEPDSFAVTKFKVRILADRAQYEQSLEILKKFVDGSNLSGSSSVSDNEANRKKMVCLINAANTIEELLGKLPQTEKDSDPKQLAAAKLLTDQAEEYWREIAKLHPEGTLRLVRFLSQHGKRDEALAIVETAWQKGKPSSIATTVVSLISNGEATPSQVKRVELIINDAIITFGETSPLLLAMAELRSIQRRYEEAEAIYRKVLDKEPKNVVALNNLAVFLALRNIKGDESLKFIDRAIAIAGPKPILLDSRASVNISRGDWKNALADLDVAISGQPMATRYFHQAHALRAAKQKDKAATALKKAHDMGLTEDELQPLERPAYRKLREELK